MSYDTDKTERLVLGASNISQRVVGKKVVSIDLPIGFPIHYSNVTLVFEDGTKLEICSQASGCSECNPEDMDYGVDVDLTPA